MKKTETDIVTIEVVSLATLMNGFQAKVSRVTLLMLTSATPSLSLFSFLKRNSDRREKTLRELYGLQSNSHHMKREEEDAIHSG